jgi:hypothetical protein
MLAGGTLGMAQDQKPSNTIGDIINNQGIVTQGQTGNNIIVNPVRRDANGIYQSDKKIGDAPPPAIDEANGIATFQALHFTNYPDQSKPLEYGNLYLSAEGTPQPRPNTYAGTLSIMIARFKAKIVGRR